MKAKARTPVPTGTPCPASAEGDDVGTTPQQIVQMLDETQHSDPERVKGDQALQLSGDNMARMREEAAMDCSETIIQRPNQKKNVCPGPL